MAKSLQDQLLKAGLANEKQAKKVKADKRKQQKQAKNQGKKRPPAEDENKRLARESMEAKKQKDAELNRQKLEADKAKATMAEIADLIDKHKLAKENNDSDVEFFFEDNGKIKKLYVAPKYQQQLSSRQLAIVTLSASTQDDRHYELVPISAAEKIKERDERCVVFIAEETVIDENDPYAKYQVPDEDW